MRRVDDPAAGSGRRARPDRARGLAARLARDAGARGARGPAPCAGSTRSAARPSRRRPTSSPSSTAPPRRRSSRPCAASGPTTRSSARRAPPIPAPPGTPGTSIRSTARRASSTTCPPGACSVARRRRRRDGRRSGVPAGPRRAVRRRRRPRCARSTAAGSHRPQRPISRWRWSAPASATRPTTRRAQAERARPHHRRHPRHPSHRLGRGRSVLRRCRPARRATSSEHLNAWDAAAGELIATRSRARARATSPVARRARPRCWRHARACTMRSRSTR